MTEFTPTVTISLDTYEYLKSSNNEYDSRMVIIEDRIREHDKENNTTLHEDMRDDGLFNNI